MNLSTDKPSPIEVILRPGHVGIMCTVVTRQDTRTDAIDVQALTMRGAQKEVTTTLRNIGYQPVARWEIVDGDTARVFRIPRRET